MNKTNVQEALCLHVQIRLGSATALYTGDKLENIGDIFTPRSSKTERSTGITEGDLNVLSDDHEMQVTEMVNFTEFHRMVGVGRDLCGSSRRREG